MKIKLKIISVNAAENQVVVRYYTDLLSEASLDGRTDFAVSLPIPEPTGQALADYLQSLAPSAFLAERETMLNVPVTLDSLTDLVGAEIVPDDTRPGPTAAEIAAKARADRIAQIKMELLVLDSKKVRPLAEGDTEYLATLNAQTATLRAELVSL